jgi:hypothetical protein
MARRQGCHRPQVVVESDGGGVGVGVSDGDYDDHQCQHR